MLNIHTADTHARSVESREVQGAALALSTIYKGVTVPQVVDVARALNTPVPEFFGAVDAYIKATHED